MDDMELESGESDLGSYAATVRTCWSVKACSGEPLASVVTKKQAGKRHWATERVGYQGPLPSVDYSTLQDYCSLYEDLNISTEEQNIEVDSVDETPGWLAVYCMRIYDCINRCDSSITFSKTEK